MTEKSKALAAALAQIEKQFGSLIMRGRRRGDREHPVSTASVSILRSASAARAAGWSRSTVVR